MPSAGGSELLVGIREMELGMSQASYGRKQLAQEEIHRGLLEAVAGVSQESQGQAWEPPSLLLAVHPRYLLQHSTYSGQRSRGFMLTILCRRE